MTLTQKISILVYVQPRASKSEIAGMHGDALKIRLAAPPVDGAANEALIAFVAKLVGVSKSAVQISAGDKSRRKTVEIFTDDPEGALALLRHGK